MYGEVAVFGDEHHPSLSNQNCQYRVYRHPRCSRPLRDHFSHTPPLHPGESSFVLFLSDTHPSSTSLGFSDARFWLLRGALVASIEADPFLHTRFCIQVSLLWFDVQRGARLCR
jgi:hypothetical protein